MTPAGITLTTLFILGVLFLPRIGAALTVMAAVCYITQGQRFTLFAFHFTAIRLVLLATIIRILIRGEYKALMLNAIDKSVMAYAGAMMLIYTFRVGTMDAFVYEIGCAYDILLSYFVFRCLLTNLDELQNFLRSLAILIVPFALLMIIESVTGRNTLAVFGGIPYHEGELVRAGRIRCMESFRTPITAGTFGASLMPLFAGLMVSRNLRPLAVTGLLAATAITVTSNSGGPLLIYLSGLTALLFWPWRKDMKIVRRGIVAALIGLHVVMKAPVWYLLDKIGTVTGGDSWYRSFLLDTWSRHFSDWWLIGTNHPEVWMPESWNSSQDVDITSQYIVAGVNGGILVLVLFITMIVRGFRSLGGALERVRWYSGTSEWMLWCLGAALFGHLMNFFSVSYFDQMHVAWWGFLAIASTVTSNILGQGLTARVEEQPIAEELAFSELPQATEMGTVVASPHYSQEFE